MNGNSHQSDKSSVTGPSLVIFDMIAIVLMHRLGLESYLHLLKHSGKSLIAVSQSECTRNVLQQLGLSAFFDFVVYESTEDIVDTEERIFEHLLRCKYECKGQQCLCYSSFSNTGRKLALRKLRSIDRMLFDMPVTLDGQRRNWTEVALVDSDMGTCLYATAVKGAHTYHVVRDESPESLYNWATSLHDGEPVCYMLGMDGVSKQSMYRMTLLY